MRSPAPSAERIDSMTVSTAVAALARGIAARPTTRSTMSALIIFFPPGSCPPLYLPLSQPDSVGEGPGRRVGKLAEEVQVLGRHRPRLTDGHQEERNRLLADEDRLHDALAGPSPEGRRELVVAREKGQGAEVENSRQASVHEDRRLGPGRGETLDRGRVHSRARGGPSRHALRAGREDDRALGPAREGLENGVRDPVAFRRGRDLRERLLP